MSEQCLGEQESIQVVAESSRPSGLLGTKPAYPTTYDNAHAGLTKRELFAVTAMQGFASLVLPNGETYDADHAARDAVKWADALLKELAR